MTTQTTTTNHQPPTTNHQPQQLQQPSLLDCKPWQLQASQLIAQASQTTDLARLQQPSGNFVVGRRVNRFGAPESTGSGLPNRRVWGTNLNSASNLLKIAHRSNVAVLQRPGTATRKKQKKKHVVSGKLSFLVGCPELALNKQTWAPKSLAKLAHCASYQLGARQRCNSAKQSLLGTESLAGNLSP